MSKPHIIIDGSISWEEFKDLCQRNDTLIRTYTENFQGRFLWPRSYSFTERDIRITDDKISLFNGPFQDYKFLAEDNLMINHGVGYLYLMCRKYDTKDTGKTEENSEGYEVPIFEKLTTFKLTPIRAEIWERKPSF